MTTNQEVSGGTTPTPQHSTPHHTTPNTNGTSTKTTTGATPPSGSSGSSGSDKLTIERANSIGWFFIESYYELYNKNINSLYKLYNSDASISHGDISTISKTLRQGSGTQSIKNLFNDLNNNQSKNKIIIVNADIQLCLNKCILIVVTGEWSKNNSPYYQFNQTFVLCRGVNESTFDIANDILRFIDYDFNHKALAEKDLNKSKADGKGEQREGEGNDSKVEGVEKDEKPQELGKIEKDEKSKGLVEESTEPTTKPTTEPTTEAQTTEPTGPTQQPDQSPDQQQPDQQPDQQSPQQDHSSNDEQPENQEHPSNSNDGPISWAALAATAKDKSPISSNKPSPNLSKTQPKKSPVTQTPVTPLPNGKYKKEDWFPIYIRSCEELTEKDLKDHLTKEFGEIKFLRQNMNIALCDFLESEGQRKALEAKKTIINGIEVSLEVRESKAAKKDNKLKNDPKRKLDKKQPKKK